MFPSLNKNEHSNCFPCVKRRECPALDDRTYAKNDTDVFGAKYDGVHLNMRNNLFARYNQGTENALTYKIDSFYLSIRKVDKNHLAFAFDESDRERTILGLRVNCSSCAVTSSTRVTSTIISFLFV